VCIFGASNLDLVAVELEDLKSGQQSDLVSDCSQHVALKREANDAGGVLRDEKKVERDARNSDKRFAKRDRERGKKGRREEMRKSPFLE
jgi:hypothetical protein